MKRQDCGRKTARIILKYRYDISYSISVPDTLKILSCESQVIVRRLFCLLVCNQFIYRLDEHDKKKLLSYSDLYSKPFADSTTPTQICCKLPVLQVAVKASKRALLCCTDVKTLHYLREEHCGNSEVEEEGHALEFAESIRFISVSPDACWRNSQHHVEISRK